MWGLLVFWLLGLSGPGVQPHISLHRQNQGTILPKNILIPYSLPVFVPKQNATWRWFPHSDGVWFLGLSGNIPTFLFTEESKAQFLSRIFLGSTFSEPQRTTKTILTVPAQLWGPMTLEASPSLITLWFCDSVSSILRGPTPSLLPWQLVVHVGVSGMATTVTLEKCGHNVGYKGLDNCRFCPGSQCCVEGGPECIDSIIDMDAVSSRVSALGLDVTVTISKDAGRYLCDFTYYTSLYQSHGRSAFVHVPPLGKPYSAEQLGRALQAIIEEMLDFLEHSEDKINCQHEH
uniref:Pyroglutamyl-peptidase I n=1 Tax=Geospiza parvula TaxID=87175 RepID=A0A8C3NEL8_GEOPR